MRHGTEVMLAAVTELRQRDFDAQTLLPEWDRCSLVAHLARNADALGRLLNWASTGVENPMYSSPPQRIDEDRRVVASEHPSLARRPTREHRARGRGGEPAACAPVVISGAQRVGPLHHRSPRCHGCGRAKCGCTRSI
jgi:maleylpyruvate isomerase